MSKINKEWDWIESAHIKPVKHSTANAPTFPTSSEKSKFTVRDSSYDLLNGCQVTELDSIPGEFYDYVKLSS